MKIIEGWLQGMYLQGVELVNKIRKMLIKFNADEEETGAGRLGTEDWIELEKAIELKKIIGWWLDDVGLKDKVSEEEKTKLVIGIRGRFEREKTELKNEMRKTLLGEKGRVKNE